MERKGFSRIRNGYKSTHMWNYSRHKNKYWKKYWKYVPFLFCDTLEVSDHGLSVEKKMKNPVRSWLTFQVPICTVCFMKNNHSPITPIYICATLINMCERCDCVYMSNVSHRQGINVWCPHSICRRGWGGASERRLLSFFVTFASRDRIPFNQSICGARFDCVAQRHTMGYVWETLMSL